MSNTPPQQQQIQQESNENDEFVVDEIEDFDDSYLNADQVLETHEFGDEDGEPQDNEEDYDENDEESDSKNGDLMLKLPDVDHSIARFIDHQSSVYACAIGLSQDNKNNELELALSGDGDDLAYLWNATTGDLIHRLTGHTDSVIACSFSFDGVFAATGSMDGTVRVYNTKSGELAAICEGPAKEIEWIVWHPAGHVLACGSEDCTVWLFSITADAATVMQVFSGHTDAVHCGTFTTDGKQLVTAGADGTLFVWNCKTGQAIHHLTTLHQEPIVSLAVNSNRIAITGSLDGVAKLVNIDTGRILATLKGHEDSIEGVSFNNMSTGLKLCATASTDNTAKIWDLNNNSCRATIEHPAAVTGIKFHPNPQQPFLYTSCTDSNLRIIDSRTGTILATLSGHADAILQFNFNKAGTKIISASDDQLSLIFDSNPNAESNKRRAPQPSEEKKDDTKQSE